MDVTGLADPYVKIYLLCNSQRISKKKTHVKKRTLSPIFNESFVFEIPNGANGLANITLEFMLLDWDRLTKNEVSYRSFNISKISCQKYFPEFQENASEFFQISLFRKYFLIIIIQNVSKIIFNFLNFNRRIS